MPGLHDKRLCAVWNYENAEGIMTAYKNDNAHVAKAGSLFVHFCDAADCKEWGSFGFKTTNGQLWLCRAHKLEGEDALTGRKK